MSEVIKLNEAAVDWREVDGEIVVLDRRSAVYMAINRTGAALWDALVEGATAPALVERLVGRYGIAAEQAQRDVDAFVAALREQELLES